MELEQTLQALLGNNSLLHGVLLHDNDPNWVIIDLAFG